MKSQVLTLLSELRLDLEYLIVDLHRFPLHALFDERFTITYLPSAQVGLNIQNHNLIGEWHIKPLLNVDDPAINGIDQMPFAQLESAIVRQLFANSTSIVQDQATKLSVIENLSKNYFVFHFTGLFFYLNFLILNCYE